MESKKTVDVVQFFEIVLGYDLDDEKKQILRGWADNPFNILSAIRQSGKTTLGLGFIFWCAVAFPSTSNLILTFRQISVSVLRDRFTECLQKLSDFLEIPVAEFVIVNRKDRLVFKNKSSIDISVASPSSLLGKTYNVMFLDEAAFWGSDKWFLSLMPYILSLMSNKIDYKIIVASTFPDTTPTWLRKAWHMGNIWNRATMGSNNTSLVNMLKDSRCSESEYTCNVPFPVEHCICDGYSTDIREN
jgi:hypothetical protein